MSRLGPNSSDPVLLQAEAKVVAARIKDTIGLTSRVVVEPPDAIERSVGKARRSYISGRANGRDRLTGARSGRIWNFYVSQPVRAARTLMRRMLCSTDLIATSALLARGLPRTMNDWKHASTA